VNKVTGSLGLATLIILHLQGIEHDPAKRRERLVMGRESMTGMDVGLLSCCHACRTGHCCLDADVRGKKSIRTEYKRRNGGPKTATDHVGSVYESMTGSGTRSGSQGPAASSWSTESGRFGDIQRHGHIRCPSEGLDLQAPWERHPSWR
jgi:hypothetical protein